MKPSIKSLRDVFGPDAERAREILDAPRARILELSAAARERDERSHHPHKTYVLRMAALAELGAPHGICGVEAIETRRGLVEFLNAGDPYVATLIRYPSGTYRVGCIGDVAQ